MRTGLLYHRSRKWSPPFSGVGTPPPRAVRRVRSSSERQYQVAKQTTVTLVDDLDGSVADEQVEFAMDGKAYEIDLSSANSARLRDALAPFISAARRTGGRRRSGGAVATSRPSTDREQNQAIREWAQQQGM